MKRNKIKRFAMEARIQLMKEVNQMCNKYGIYKQEQGILLLPFKGNKEELKQRQNLIMKIDDTSYDQVIEEVAYIWFNRFIALRYMEVNGYLPYGMNIFTNKQNEFKPEMIDYVMDLKLAGLDDQLIYEYVLNNQNEELYRYLLITICNDMNQYLPALFKKLSDECILLLPNQLLSEDSVIAKMITMVDDRYFHDQIEIIGWLYQYYNSEMKDQVIDINQISVKKQDIPYATQVFTPDWIVRYLVDNSLGKYYLKRNENSLLKSQLNYYIDDHQVIQEPFILKNLKVLDPCMGSGHILVYAFEVLLKMYQEQGYVIEDAVEHILNDNLYGFDIDKRAFQLAYFALMMKARKYHSQILNIHPTLNIIELKESDIISDELLNELANDQNTYDHLKYIKMIFKDSKEIGSILNLKKITQLNIRYDHNRSDKEYERMMHLLKQYRLMNDQYQIVVTNPTYMNKNEGELKQYIQKHYKDYGGDLFSVFMYKNFQYATSDGYCGFMTPFVWMFIKSYEKLRTYICDQKQIDSLVQMEYGAFKEAMVPICCFVLSNEKHGMGTYIRLSDFRGGMQVQDEMLLAAIADEQCSYRYQKDSAIFMNFNHHIIAYWLDPSFNNLFMQEMKLKDYADACVGLQSGDNERFLKYWYEVEYDQIAFKQETNKKYYPYNKGGNYRKWYGNEEYVIYYENDGELLKQSKSSVIRNPHTYMKEHITWSKVSSGKISFRYKSKGKLYDVAGTSIFNDDHDLLMYLLGILNSNVIDHLLTAISPTMNYEVGQIASIPMMIARKQEVIDLVNTCIQLSKEDYDDFEISYDFKKHPFISNESKQYTLKQHYEQYALRCEKRFMQLKNNEKHLNQIVNDIYKVQCDVEVEDKNIKMFKASEEKVIKSLLSYMVGWMFDRYDHQKDYVQYKKTNKVIPISKMVEAVKHFIKKVFNEDDYDCNIAYLHQVIGVKNDFDSDLFKYFLNDFYKEHFKTYNKKPIYWMLDSGKKHAYCAYICVHNFNESIYDVIKEQLLNCEEHDEIKTYLKHFNQYQASDFNLNYDLGIKNNYQLFLPLLRAFDK